MLEFLIAALKAYSTLGTINRSRLESNAEYLKAIKEEGKVNDKTREAADNHYRTLLQDSLLLADEIEEMMQFQEERYSKITRECAKEIEDALREMYEAHSKLRRDFAEEQQKYGLTNAPSE